MTMQDSRPKIFPPPEFPPHRAALFARTPPAIFPPILGLMGLAMAAKLAFVELHLDPAAADMLGGGAVALWLFAAIAYFAKMARRPGVVLEDLRVLPGRSGLAALTMGGMAAATLVAPHGQWVAGALLLAALAGHSILAVLLIRVLLSLAPAAREVNPTWHVSFVGFIVGAPAAVALGWTGLAVVLFWAATPVAIAIWALSAWQFRRVSPPAALRPLLAIHVAPAALLACVAAMLGSSEMSAAFVTLGTAFAVLLVLSGGWLTEAGVTPLWGAFTFPMAALATAMLTKGSGWEFPGYVLTLAGVLAIPAILWWVLKRWPGGKLAAVTNAAEA
jgi:tellurite resistance protein